MSITVSTEKDCVASLKGKICVTSSRYRTVQFVSFYQLNAHSTAYGTLSCFDKLLEYDAPLNEIDSHGATPLHYGCQRDANENLNNARSKVINMLLLNGAKLDAVDNEGRKPIHWAASSGM